MPINCFFQFDNLSLVGCLYPVLSRLIVILYDVESRFYIMA